MKGTNVRWLVVVTLAIGTACGGGGGVPGDVGGDGGGDAVVDVDGDSLIDVVGGDAAGDSAGDVTGGDAGGDSAGDVTGGDADADAPADVPPDAPADTVNDADAAGSVQCGQAPPVFPAFAKGCVADADCFVALHQVNCCGTQVALGLAKSAQADFAAAEKVCQGQYPGCGCAQTQTVAEDGYGGWNDATFVATCQQGVCRSAVQGAKPVCTDAGLQQPEAPKSCAATSDCTYLLQTVDCCGSQKAVGVAKYAKEALEKVEFACTQEMAVCDCAPKPVVLEDGGSAGDGLIAVQCDGGFCMSYVK